MLFVFTFRAVCMQYRKDQEVCDVVLQLVCRLVSQLCDDGDMVSVARSQARNVTLYLLQVFWYVELLMFCLCSMQVVSLCVCVCVSECVCVCVKVTAYILLGMGSYCL